jgi:hypothetical protein
MNGVGSIRVGQIERAIHRMLRKGSIDGETALLTILRARNGALPI